MKDNILSERKLLKLIRGQKKMFSLSRIKRIILVAFILSGVYFITCFIYPFTGLKRIKLPNLNQEKAGEFKLKIRGEIRPLDAYLSDIKNRQIFTVLSVPQEIEKSAPVVINTDLIKDLSLVGIISGDIPQAVIEDRKMQKTYTVTAGQFFGEFKVEAIGEGKVLINYQEQKFELYL